jgi:low affinity Fe/Cu permease
VERSNPNSGPQAAIEADLRQARRGVFRGTERALPVCLPMGKRIRQLLTDAGTWLARPWAFTLVGIYVALWIYFDPGSFGWPAGASIATLLMTLFIQRSEHRDTQAIHAKLDELLRVHGDAQSRLTKLDREEPEQIEAYRNTAQAHD